MKVYPILDNVVHNNRVIMAKGYTTDLSIERLKRFYTRRWDNRVVFDTFGSWKQIITMRDNCLFTVQVAEASDGSHGRLVITPAPTGPLGEVGIGVLIPPGSQVVTDTVMDDGPKQGRFSVVASGSSPSVVARFYRAHMGSGGWRLEHDWSEADREVLIFRDGLKLMNIVIQPSPEGSNIVINTEEPK